MRLHSLLRRLTSMIAALSMIATIPVPSTAASAASAEGAPEIAVAAPGLGDPYYPEAGNRGYDVRHYDLNIRYDPATRKLTGVSTMTAASEKALAGFTLDFFGLTLDGVTVDGQDARTSRTETKLTVTPERAIAAGRDFTVVAKYHGTPKRYGSATDGDGFFITRDGGTVVGQPRAAACWFPVNDHPSDKAAYTFTLTVPQERSAIANGMPKGRRSADGWTTWRYEEPSPMAPYLATISIGDFDLDISDHHGIPMVLAVNRHVGADNRRVMMDQLRKTGKIIDFLAKWFGPYPFTSAGGIVTSPDFTHDALENQARPVYSERRLTEGLIVHELAHQWFGDSVSLDSWKDIWLNEGFATYAQWLYDEETGKASADATFREYYRRSADSGTWSPAPGDPGRERMFSDSVYLRGAMTVHALRRTVGDQAFFAILREWTDKHKDANATTKDFITVAGEVSGRDLEGLFKPWLFGSAKPPVPAAIDMSG